MNEIIKKANELKNKATWEPFHYTAASVSDTIDGRYVLIKSYATIVGMVDKTESKMYEFGKYSHSTSKQFTRIHNEFFDDCERVFINETNW
jgi:hypothetical protein